MTYVGHTWVASHCDTVALSLLAHGAKLADTERLASLANARLHKKHGTLGIDFNEDGDNQQRYKQYSEPNERHDAVEAPLEKEPYFVFIFLHVA